MSTKPILFNTEMVQAILDGRKTVTRRVIKKPLPELLVGETMTPAILDDGNWTFQIRPWNNYYEGELKAPCYKGDILYVRETWRIQSAHRFEADAKIEFAAGGPMTKLQFRGCRSDSHERPDYDRFINKWWNDDGKWHPSIFMPKEAARIFLRVKNVRVERLQDITADECPMEGVWPLAACTVGERDTYYRSKFAELWDSTIKPADIATYGWDANPWVWVIKFEKINKEEVE